MKLQDTFNQWVDLAKQRATVMLMDGRPATLIAVRKPSRNCKIELGGRHYTIWIDDIALVQWPGASNWVLLDAWPVVDLDRKPGVQITSKATAEKSRNWLKVVPNPEVLHPSFQPKATPARPTPEPKIQRKQNLWLVPNTPPPTTSN